jgi:hypothetical protein
MINRKLLPMAMLLLTCGLRVAAGEELLVQYSASTVNAVAGEPVCFRGTFEFNTLAGTASALGYSPTGYLLNWNYSVQGTGTITEQFANGSTVTLNEAGTFNAHGGSLGQYGPVIQNFGPPSVGLFAPDGYVDYTMPTEAQFLASPDPWAQILSSAQVVANEGYFFDGQYFSDNTGKLQISPVPTPPTLWLMLAGVGGLVFFGRKRFTV